MTGVNRAGDEKLEAGWLEEGEQCLLFLTLLAS